MGIRNGRTLGWPSVEREAERVTDGQVPTITMNNTSGLIEVNNDMQRPR